MCGTGFLATPGVGCNCFRRGILRRRMRLERCTRSPDTDAASFSRMSAPFTLHAKESVGAGVEIKSRGARVTEGHWAKAGAGPPLLLSNINHPFTELSPHWPVSHLW